MGSELYQALPFKLISCHSHCNISLRSHPHCLVVLELPWAFMPLIRTSQAPFRLEAPPPPAPHLGPSRLFADVFSFLMLFTLNPPEPGLLPARHPAAIICGSVVSRTRLGTHGGQKNPSSNLLEKEFTGGISHGTQHRSGNTPKLQ